MTRTWMLIAALLGPSGAYAAATGLGGVFQDQAVGTRAVGMAGAFVAVADDANAVQENPAGMAFFDKKDRLATFTHSNLFSTGFLSRDFIAYAQADNGFGALGFSWNRFSADLNPEQWTEDAYMYSGARLLSLGEDRYPKLALGWQAKYLRVDSGFSNSSDFTAVGNGTATGYGFGLGTMIKLRPSLSVGIMLQDLYSSISWASGTLEVLPTTGKAGVAYKLTEGSTLSAEFRGQQGSSGFTPSSWHVGAETWLLSGKQLLWNAIKNVAARGGIYQVLDNSDSGRVVVGASAKADSWQLDYAYEFGLSDKALGATHRFGLGFNF